MAAEEPAELSEDNSEADDVAANLERRRRLEGTFGADYEAPGWLQRWRDKRSELFEKAGLDFIAFGDGVENVPRVSNWQELTGWLPPVSPVF